MTQIYMLDTGQHQQPVLSYAHVCRERDMRVKAAGPNLGDWMLQCEQETVGRQRRVARGGPVALSFRIGYCHGNVN